MVAKARTEDQAQETQPTEAELLMQKIEAMLNALPPTPTQDLVAPRMTPEAQAALAAPLDPKFIKERKGDNGKMYSYADLDYLEGRAREVDPEWSSHLSGGGPNVVLCDITILGVTHGATAGYYIGDTYEVWDGYKKEMVVKPMTSRVAHTIIGAAEAAAERRAFAKFRLGEELWKKDQDSELYKPEGDHAPASGGKTQFRTSSGGGGSQSREFREPSEARIKLLTDLGVPEAVAKLINSESHKDSAGKFMKDAKGNPISDVSETITALFAARGRDKGPLARKTWELIVSERAPYALASTSTAGRDDDADNDDDF